MLLEYADNLAPAMVLGVSHREKSSRVTLSSIRLSAASSSYAADGDFHETLSFAASARLLDRDHRRTGSCRGMISNLGKFGFREIRILISNYR
jgi:hypothetical protein